MKRQWLAIDVNYLGYRALFSTGNLAYEGRQTGSIYGILHTIFTLRDRFQSNHILWCFDHGKNLRNKIEPTYKQSEARKKFRELNKDKIDKMKEQLEQLKKLLPIVGCKNVIYEKGYEADDCIAQSIIELRKDVLTANDPVVIVSADKDMYQLLSPNVSVFDPRAGFEMTYKVFVKAHKIKPKEWIWVKAIAGCGTDNIKGILGVGEKTAIRFMNNSIIIESKLGLKINDFINERKFIQNKKLIRLPLKGFPDLEVRIEPDLDRSCSQWKPLFKQFGFKTL